MRKPRRSAPSKASSKRDLAPPELRYQYLRAGPGRSPWALRGIAGGIGVTSAIAMFMSTGLVATLFIGPMIALLVNGMFRGAARLLGPSKDFRAAPVAIVPWGIVIDPDRSPVPVPWQRLREVSYTRIDQNGNQSTEGAGVAVMLFDTVDAGTVQAQGEDGEWVTSMDAFAPRFARNAPRPLAGDVEGTQALETGGLPASLALVRRAEAILQSADGRAALGLEAGDYRSTSSRIAGPATRALLRDALWNDRAGPDPGPLAAVLCAELGIVDVLPDLLQLILSTSPLLAATARAAAARLGASPVAAGSVNELEDFLPGEEIAELRRWLAAAAATRKEPANPFQQGER
jgi:hypothetical protein